jgi:Transposase, Mutator family
MAFRVSPTERIRSHIDDLFAADRLLPEIPEEVARFGAQLLMQAALEAEVTEFLGRDRYQRAGACQDSRAGCRKRLGLADHGMDGRRPPPAVVRGCATKINGQPKGSALCGQL